MRGMLALGCDLEVDVRFVDMLLPRRSVILDLGCGIGSAVRGLRDRGHEAYGIDPTESVLAVELDMLEPAWFRLLGAGDISSATLGGQGLPGSYDLILMSGNVPAFLNDEELASTFR